MRLGYQCTSLIVAGAALVGTAAARADAVSTFDADAEGWLATGNATIGVEFVSTDGIPAGAIRLTDGDNGYGYFVAPAAFRSVARFGSIFSFDLRTTSSGPEPVAHPVQIAIEGGGMVLINGAALPTTQFVQYTWTLTPETGWRLYPSRVATYQPGTGIEPTTAQLRAVFDHITGVFISADYTNGHTGTGTTETTTIDNVVMSPPSGPMPDMNCDGELTVADIAPFVVALTDPVAYEAQFPFCEIDRADQNVDGQISVGDIAIFVARLQVR